MHEVRIDETSYRSLVETALDCAVIVLDEDGRVADWNSGAARIEGFRAEEIVGRHFSLFYPRESAQTGKPERDLFGAVGAEGQFKEEGWRIRKDGSRFWAQVVIKAARDEAGDVAGFLMLIRDLTEQKQTEIELRRSQERFHRAVESAPNAMIMVNRTGRIEMLNLQAELVFGYSRDELLGQPIEMLIPERFRRQHPAHRRLFFADPKSRPMGAGRDLYAISKDGTEFPVEIGLNIIDTDEGAMVLAAIVDISERKEKEEALWRSQERFRSVVESAPNAMVLVGRRGTIKMVNFQMERLFGYSRAELLGRPIEMLIPERFRKDHPGFRASFFADPQLRPMGAGRDLYGLRKDGSEIAVEIGLNPIETDGGLMVLAAIVDITDRKRSEQQLRAALGERDNLLREIHHRVKNNLQIVQSMLNLQSARTEDPVALGILRGCRNRIQSMALVYDILDQSHDFVKVDFERFLDSLAPRLMSSYGIDPSRIRLSVDAAGVSLPIEKALSCGQLVNELIANSLEHAFPEGRSGEITVESTVDANGDVVLSVSDNGVGVPVDIDVTRAETSGLQLVNLLANRLGGTLSIERAEQTRFTVQFSLDRLAQAQDNPTEHDRTGSR